MKSPFSLEERIIRAIDTSPEPNGMEISDPKTAATPGAYTPNWKNHLLVADGFSVEGEKLFPANYVDSFYRCESEPLEPLCQDLLQRFSIGHNNNDWGIYFPCGYDKVKDTFKQIDVQHPAQKIALIPGSNQIVSKSILWTILREYYGRKSAARLMPESFILNSPEEMALFRTYYSNKIKILPEFMFVLKNNRQRQKGLHLTRDLAEIESAAQQGYLLVQEFLEDPLLIDSRKINLRFYLCLTGWQNRMQLHIHKSGFVYYARDIFKEPSLDFHQNITSGYVDRSIYRDHPLTHRDMIRWLTEQGLDTEQMISRIHNLFREVMVAVSPRLCQEPEFDINPKFQLFGADIALDNRLQPRLLEINKGPDLYVKGLRDGMVKKKVFLDLLDLVNIINSPHSNEFRKIWEAVTDPEPVYKQDVSGLADKEFRNK